MAIVVKFVRLAPSAICPVQATPGAAGYDIFTATSGTRYIDSECDFISLDTGLAVEIPPGYFGRIEGRSGFAKKHNLIVHSGIIDCDYRGEIKVLVKALKGSVEIKHGTRIAQLVVLPRVDVQFEEATEGLTKTHRGEGGFGSSGNGLLA